MLRATLRLPLFPGRTPRVPCLRRRRSSPVPRVYSCCRAVMYRWIAAFFIFSKGTSSDVSRWKNALETREKRKPGCSLSLSPCVALRTAFAIHVYSYKRSRVRAGNRRSGSIEGRLSSFRYFIPWLLLAFSILWFAGTKGALQMLLTMIIATEKY